MQDPLAGEEAGQPRFDPVAVKLVVQVRNSRQDFGREEPNLAGASVGDAHQIDGCLAVIDSECADPLVVFRNAGIRRAFAPVADAPNPSDEGVVHQLAELLGELLSFGGALGFRELEVLGGILILTVLNSLQKADHRPMRSASSQRIAGFSLRVRLFVFMRLWLTSFLSNAAAEPRCRDRQEDKKCKAAKTVLHNSCLRLYRPYSHLEPGQALDSTLEVLGMPGRNHFAVPTPAACRGRAAAGFGRCSQRTMYQAPIPASRCFSVWPLSGDTEYICLSKCSAIFDSPYQPITGQRPGSLRKAITTSAAIEPNCTKP